MKAKSSHTKKLTVIKVLLFILTAVLLMVPKLNAVPQIEMRALIIALGIDNAENGVKCSAQVVYPKTKGEGSGLHHVISGEGVTVSDALNNMSIALGRKVDLNHCAIVAIGKEKAFSGVLEELEYLLAGGIILPETNLVVSENKDAFEFLEKLNKYSNNLDVTSLLRYLDMGIHNYSEGVLKFVSDLKSKSAAACLPCVEMGDKAENHELGVSEQKFKKDTKQEKSNEGDSKEKTGQEEGEEGGSGEEKQEIIKKSVRLAVFKQGKCVDVWDSNPTRGVAWMDKETREGLILLDRVDILNETIYNLPCKLKTKSIKTKASFKDGIPVFTVKICAKIYFEERHALSGIIYGENKQKAAALVPALKNRIAEIIDVDIKSAFKESKKDGADVFLVKDSFYRYANKEYKTYDSAAILDDAKLVTDIKIKISM